jgi:CheY-like chemotaxis protein
MARIVVVDDEPAARTAISRILEKEGHEVQQYEDGRPALDDVDYSKVDLAIVDLQMPTSGYDVIEEIRARGFDKLPIIVASANVDLVLTPEVLGVQEIIEKPFQIADFSDAVKKLLEETDQ